MSPNGGRRPNRCRPSESCAECRRRKIRCKWPAGADHSQRVVGDARSCSNCLARGKICHPAESAASRVTRPTARDRIASLESQVAALTTLVQEKHSQCHSALGRAYSSPSVSASYANANLNQDSRKIHHGSSLIRPQRSSIDSLTSAQDIIGNGKHQISSDPTISKLNHIRAKLQSLLPAREEIARIASSGSGWMSTYYSLFDDQLVANYDRLLGDNTAQPASLAVFLLILAISLKQTQSEDVSSLFRAERSAEDFIADVIGAVEDDIVAHSTFAGTVHGAEATLLLAILLLGTGNFKNAWLTMRRAVALAEIMGFPQAADDTSNAIESDMAGQNVDSDTLGRKTRLWDSICATERYASVVFNLPAATASYPLNPRLTIAKDEGICAQAYNYKLSAICLEVQKLDSSCICKAAEADIYANVLSADRELRYLASQTPRMWWLDYASHPLQEQIVQITHSYLCVRIHLRAALMDRPEYAYSRATCHAASREVAQRYCNLTPLSPSVLFLDIQAFTASIFLLLSSHSPRGEQDLQDDLRSLHLVYQTLSMFKKETLSSDFAQEAVKTLTSLHELFAREDALQAGEVFTLQIPMWAVIHIRRSNDSDPIERGADNGFSDKRPWTFDIEIKEMWLQDLNSQ